MCQWFAPVDMIITTEGEYFRRAGVIEKDADGQVTKINLPSKIVMVANHQVSLCQPIYCDWWYLWAFTKWTGGSKDVIIVLKKSLKWIPVFGWAMQWFRFVFLARSWATDSKYFVKKLAEVADYAEKYDDPLFFMLYPEGTLVSKDTRPISKKWADKTGIEDMQHMLLPRATGLQWTLRSLAPRVSGLKLLDITVAYEGIPRNAYGQSHYTLRSVFMSGIPPPNIHLHLRIYDVKTEVPIGDVDIRRDKAATHSRTESEATQEERQVFENWLLQRWREKDALLEGFHQIGLLAPPKKSQTECFNERFTIPMALGSLWELVALLLSMTPSIIAARLLKTFRRG
ncbi:hypothetical protein SISSUDRAFT_981995 [Sistotremastrum suecicum HHB10207 ss-3]|uniref:Phospholipid/glycerol acyltransferase domain-containing protein n=1 Tax=Sistotremastrum suecicum HHB10207 ss-3 TaxID=1314776 RepID=A0A166G877_9AGAM|nr:hypothetical protein SISSUDRAFT_981995 [Sistotremastrum suecicum HHB10207 ss-3]